MNKPFIGKLDTARALYSGSKDDMVPLFAIRPGKDGNIIFQIPGGNSLDISSDLAFELAEAIKDVAKYSFEQQPGVLK